MPDKCCDEQTDERVGFHDLLVSALKRKWMRSARNADTSSQDIFPLVVADIESRARVGEKKYGERLKSFNGRDALRDAYEEALDLALYLKQAIVERHSPRPEKEEGR